VFVLIVSFLYYLFTWLNKGTEDYVNVKLLSDVKCPKPTLKTLYIRLLEYERLVQLLAVVKCRQKRKMNTKLKNFHSLLSCHFTLYSFMSSYFFTFTVQKLKHKFHGFLITFVKISQR
jgi:hypothetical protein